MAITDSFAAIVDEKEQRGKIIHARAIIQYQRNQIMDANSHLQEIADSGVFDTIAPEIKQALLAGKQVLQTAQTALTTGDINDLLDWRR